MTDARKRLDEIRRSLEKGTLRDGFSALVYADDVSELLAAVEAGLAEVAKYDDSFPADEYEEGWEDGQKSVRAAIETALTGGGDGE